MYFNGNIIVPDSFSWLWRGTPTEDGWEDGIWPLIDMKFGMHLHQQRERNDRNSRGWLRTMYHSLSQQIIRADLVYWSLFACLRPDYNVKLVSYPTMLNMQCLKT